MTTIPNDRRCVIAIDAGTTGVRSRAVFVDDRPVVAAYREFAQHYPAPGWVEHDATEIWNVAVQEWRPYTGKVPKPEGWGDIVSDAEAEEWKKP